MSGATGRTLLLMAGVLATSTGSLNADAGGRDQLDALFVCGHIFSDPDAELPQPWVLTEKKKRTCSSCSTYLSRAENPETGIELVISEQLSAGSSASPFAFECYARQFNLFTQAMLSEAAPEWVSAALKSGIMKQDNRGYYFFCNAEKEMARILTIERGADEFFSMVGSTKSAVGRNLCV